MPSAGVSETIFLSTSILLALGLVTILGAIIQDQGNDARERSDDTATALRSDVRIINDPKLVATTPLVIHARNTGDATLVVDDLLLLLDGEVSTDVTYDVLGTTDDSVWAPDQVLSATVNDLSVATGPHQVRLIAGSGVEATLRFDA